MKWRELDASLPFLGKLRGEVRECAARLLGPFGVITADLMPDEGEVIWRDLVPLLTWGELRRTQRACAPTIAAHVRWIYVAGTHLDGRDWILFRSNAGELARVPAEFVGAFLRDQKLCVDLVPSDADTQILLLVRAGVTEAEIPATLLDHLLEVRAREGNRAWPQPEKAAAGTETTGASDQAQGETAAPSRGTSPGTPPAASPQPSAAQGLSVAET